MLLLLQLNAFEFNLFSNIYLDFDLNFSIGKIYFCFNQE